MDGIRKWLRRVLDEDLLRSTLRELLESQQQPAEDLTGPLEAQLDRTRQQIGRLVDALAGGVDLPSVRGRLAELEREGVRLQTELERNRVVRIQPGNLSATIQDLIGALERFPQVLESGNDEERKVIVRAFPGNPGGKDHEAGDPEMVSPASTVSLKMVELRGLEPLTPRLPALCSPN